DGKWLAYRSAESGREEIYVQTFPAPGARYQISTEGGAEPSWRRDGRELYFMVNNRLTAVDVKASGDALEFGAPKMLFEAPFTWEIRRNRYVASADGQKFLILLVSGEQNTPIHVVLNWRLGLMQ